MNDTHHKEGGVAFVGTIHLTSPLVIIIVIREIEIKVIKVLFALNLST